MKKIINHKLYDTDTATLVASDAYGTAMDADYYEDCLYRTRKGAWFMVHEGGALSIYGERDGRDRVGSIRFEPVSEEKACKFCGNYGDPDDYAQYFREPENA